jgi:hypothetical protein
MKFVGHRFGFGLLPLKADTGGDGKPTLDLTWNGQYQLVSVSTNGVFAEGYAYDARGCVVLAGFQVLGTLQRAAENYTRARGRLKKQGKRGKVLTVGQTNRLMTLLRGLGLIEMDLVSTYMDSTPHDFYGDTPQCSQSMCEDIV